MERPFDYPGSTSDIVAPELHHLRVIHSNLQVTDDDGMMHWIVASVPDWWEDKDISEVVADRFPAERCTHAHDCCGNYYANSAAWSHHPRAWRGDKVIFISRTFTHNI